MARTWQLLAFLGRYAHQPLVQLMDFPKSDLYALAKATGELIEQEYPETGGSRG